MVEHVTGTDQETNTMIRTRIRRAALAAALAATATVAIATGPITPYAQAKPYNPNYGHNALCDALRHLANRDSDKASAAYQAGDKATGDKYAAFADEDYNIAVEQGCAWATWLVSGTGTVTSGPVGPIQLTP
jgi:hypothetical protein